MINFQSFTCEKCGKLGIDIFGYGQGAFITHHEVDDIQDYVNKDLIPQWRYNKKHNLKATVPPQLPDRVFLFTRVEEEDGSPRSIPGWNCFTKATTLGVQPPEDPILTEHRAYWEGIFEHLNIKDAKEVENRYCGSELEPWYEFQINGTFWIVGPRKRVDVIEVQSPTPLDFVAIRTLATRDNVTQYEDENSFRVHVWNKKKFFEYFYAMLSAVETRS